MTFMWTSEWPAALGATISNREMRAILCRYGATAADLDRMDVSTEIVESPSGVRGGRFDDEIDEWSHQLRLTADHRLHHAQLREALMALRAQIPAEQGQVNVWLVKHAATVNAAAPQVKSVAAFQGGALRCSS